MEYNIYLSFNNNEELIKLPVLPGELKISEGSSNKKSEVLKIGEITQMKLPPQFSIQFDSVFPCNWYPGCNVQENELKSPYDYINTIKRWKKSLKPIRFVFVGSTIDINSPVTIETFDCSEKGGDVGSWNYKIALKEYRFYGSDKINIDNNVIQKSRTNTRQTKQLYIVQEGDTLTSISIKNFGNDSAYWDIKRLNGLTDADLLDGLRAGMELRLY